MVEDSAIVLGATSGRRGARRPSGSPQHVWLVLSLLGFLALAGSAHDGHAEHAGTAPRLAPLVDPHLLRSWTLVAIETAGSPRIEPPYGPYSVVFTSDRVTEEERGIIRAGRGFTSKGVQVSEGLQVYARDGCNNHYGGYEVSGEGALALLIPRQTQVLCQPAPCLAQSFPALLERAASYYIQGDTLRITALDERSGVRSVLTFSATPPAVDAVPAPCP